MSRKIEHLWVFTAIFSVTVVFMVIFLRQTIALTQETLNAGRDNRVVIIHKADNPEEATLIFGGDIMLARTVEQKILATGDYALPFRKIYQEFEKADLAFANLESPFLSGGSATPNGSTVFRALPDTIEGLKLAGIDAVTLANNHFGDQGNKGKLFTFKHLTDNGIEYVGAGNNFTEAHQPVIKEVNGTKIGFLGYGYPETMYVATANTPGIANMDIAQMRKDIERLSDSADFIVVTMHAGAEYTHTPGQSQIAFARAAIDAGADLVVGHHPHVVQSTEKYKDGYIIYSLGNLVFDQMWSEETQQGAVLVLSIESGELSKGVKIKKMEIKPIHIYDYNQPDWAEGSEAQKILENMGLTSSFLSF
jgi:poly-gamma-glutamate capsule biosynthesis protein CapA/YwtB (metallophosphatase superfamily)